jgi:MFS family permease
VVLVSAAAGAALFAVSDNFLLLAGWALIGLGVAASLTSGLKALVLWLPKDRIPLLNGLMIMLGALGAVTATSPAELLLVSVGWRGLFELLTVVSAGCAILIYFVAPEAESPTPVTIGAVAVGLRTVYADPRFWRLAPLSATCIGTAWALQGLWTAPWLSGCACEHRDARPRFASGACGKDFTMFCEVRAAAFGQKRKSGPAILTSVLPSTADIRQRGGHVRKVPTTDMALSMTPSARARQGPAQGDATINSNYRHSDSAPIHPVARSILRTGTPEPRVKLLLLEMGH